MLPQRDGREVKISKQQNPTTYSEKKKMEGRSKKVNVKINTFLSYTMGHLYTTKFTTHFLGSLKKCS